MRAAEQGDGFACGFVGDGGVPYLGVFAQVNGGGGGDDGAVAGCSQVVGFELDGGEAAGTFGQAAAAAVAARGVGQGDNAAGVQKAVGCHHAGFDFQLGDDFAGLSMGEDNAQQTR